MVEDTAANVRPAAAAIAVGAKPKKRTSTAGRVSRSAIAFNFCIYGQIRLTRHLVIGSQGRLFFRVATPLVAGERLGFPIRRNRPILRSA